MAFTPNDWLGLILFQFLSWLPMVVAGVLISEKAWNEWYENVKRPWFMPHRFAFVLVWVAFYAVQGIAAFLAWQRPENVASHMGVYHTSLAFFLIQLIANGFWAPAFFGAHQIRFAMVIALVNFVLSFTTAVLFGFVFWASGLLMALCVAWIIYQTVLNAVVVIVNDVELGANISSMISRTVTASSSAPLDPNDDA